MPACSCCNAPSHTVRDCTSTIMLETIRNFEAEMDNILQDDILKHDAYRLTFNCAAVIGNYSTCHIQRILTVLQKKTVHELQILVSGYLRSIPLRGMNKYNLVVCLAYHYVYDSFTTHRYTIPNSMGPISQLFLRYINRGWVHKIPKIQNDRRLYQEVMSDFVVLDRLDRTRLAYCRTLRHTWNELPPERRRALLREGAFVVSHPGVNNVHFRRFFGNVEIEEILTTFPLLRHMSNMVLSSDHMTDPFVGFHSDTTIKFIPANQFESTEECPICYETVCNTYIDCKHEFCLKCMQTHIDTCRTTGKTTTCPMCRMNVSQVFANYTGTSISDPSSVV